MVQTQIFFVSFLKNNFLKKWIEHLLDIELKKTWLVKMSS
jgi:hypothetical protein